MCIKSSPTGEGHFYVFYYLCHYDFCPLCHYGFCSPVTLSFITSVPYVIMSSASFCLSFRLLLYKLFLSSYHFVDNCLNRGGEISSLFVSHF